MYILDTNICIFLIKNKSERLLNRMMSCKKEDIYLSSITIAELEYGASKSLYREKNRQAILDFCSNFINILDFTTEDTEAYGLIRAYLEKRGTPIGPYDLQIAAQGLTRNFTIVTNNYDEFARIPDLKVEDWRK